MQKHTFSDQIGAKNKKSHEKIIFHTNVWAERLRQVFLFPIWALWKVVYGWSWNFSCRKNIGNEGFGAGKWISFFPDFFKNSFFFSNFLILPESGIPFVLTGPGFSNSYRDCLAEGVKHSRELGPAWSKEFEKETNMTKPSRYATEKWTQMQINWCNRCCLTMSQKNLIRENIIWINSPRWTVHAFLGF